MTNRVRNYKFMYNIKPGFMQEIFRNKGLGDSLGPESQFIVLHIVVNNGVCSLNVSALWYFFL